MNTNQSFPRPNYIKRNLLGCLETALFMPGGAGRFSESREGMIRSLIVPFLVLPVTAATFIAAHPDYSAGGTAQIMAGIYVIRTIVYLAAFMGFSYMTAKYLDRMDCFYKMVAAHNWLLLPAALLTLPLTLGFISGHYTWNEIFPMVTLISVYFYAYLAFMSIKLLKIPVELGIFIGIAAMALNQSALSLVKTFASNALFLLS